MNELYGELQELTHELLEEWGQQGIIVREDGSTYPITFLLADYSPLDRAGGLVRLTDKRAIMSAVGIDFKPEAGSDQFLIDGEPHSIVTARETNPAGLTVMWELQVRR